MNRREFLKDLVVAAALPSMGGDVFGASNAALTQDWLARWEKNILGRARSRYCDKEMSEEIGWLMSPFLNGFYHGYRATGDAKWVALLVDWADSWINRGVEEPDGFVGWPKSGTGGQGEEGFYTDSLLGEAMGLRPIILTADEILRTPALKDKFGPQAQAYLKLAEQVFKKWDSRGCWREVANGVLWTALVPYDQTLRKIFVANHNPSGWGGLSATPWFLAREATKQKEVNL